MVFKKTGALLIACLIFIFLMSTGCKSLNSHSTSISNHYPSKPIRIIVPTTAGGSVDLMARAMEKESVKYLGQSLVVTNIPGGAATIGWNELAKAAPDGYTIGVVSTGALLQPLYSSTSYHYPTAIEPLAQTVTLPIVAAVLSDQPWQNVNDLIQYAKQHPGEIKYAHPGLGSPRHVVGEMFAREAGIDIAGVPFSGESEGLAALLGGHVQLIFANTSILKDYVKTGKIKVIAVAAEQRLTDPLFKDVPTFKEGGLDVSFSLWYGIGAPKGLPKDEKDKLAEALRGIINDAEFKKNMQDLDMVVECLGPQEFTEKWISEYSRLSKIIEETGIRERIARQKK